MGDVSDLKVGKVMKTLHDRMVELKEKCLRCWAKEYGDIFPQKQNVIIAGDEMKKHGWPECQCKLTKEQGQDSVYRRIENLDRSGN